MLERRGACRIDFGNTGDLRRGLGHAVDIIPDHQGVHIAELGSRGDGGEGRVLDDAFIMFDQDQHAHFAIPRPLSRSTSSSTLPTLIPACLLAGSVTLIVCTRRVTSTP